MQLDKWQSDFLNCKTDKILCTGRQVGKSTVCAIDAGQWAVDNPHSNPILIIAPTERQAYGLFDKVLGWLAVNYPKLIMKGKNRPTKEKISLTNGNLIYCLPVGQSGLGVRFLTIGRLYVDEASRVPEDVWSAVLPSLLTTGANAIYLSTPFGAVGEFYRCWTNKDKAYDSFTRFSINSEQVVMNREISPSWTQQQKDKALIFLEQCKSRMSRREYSQEFLGNFEQDLQRYFSEELIRKCCTGKRPEHFTTRYKYYMGCDLARMGEDYSSFEVIQKVSDDKLIQVENIETRKTLTTDTEKKIIEMNERYDFREIYIDAGAGTLGVSILDHLLVTPSTKNKIVAINNRSRTYEAGDDAKSQKLLKEDLYCNLLALMEQGRIVLLDDSDLMESLRSVQYEYVTTPYKATRLRIFGQFTHAVEGLIRACWCIHDKRLGIWCR